MTHTQTLPITQDDPQLDTPWQVVVLNDPVNLMTYVTLIFKKVFGYETRKATEHMLEVHQKGSSVLWQGPREQAELFVQILQEWQLTAKIERSDV